MTLTTELARGFLGLLNTVAIIYFRQAVDTAFGKVAGRWYMLFQASQFHIIFYASRTLPNMFAFGFSKSVCGVLLHGIHCTV